MKHPHIIEFTIDLIQAEKSILAELSASRSPRQMMNKADVRGSLLRIRRLSLIESRGKPAENGPVPRESGRSRSGDASSTRRGRGADDRAASHSHSGVKITCGERIIK